MPATDIDLMNLLVGPIEDFRQSKEFDEELATFKTERQRLPVTVRFMAESGIYEAFGRATLLAVVREHNLRNADDIRDIEVQIAQCDDEKAICIAANEIVPASDTSSFGRGQFYWALLQRYKTQDEVARICVKSKATISKTLDVCRAVEALGSKILVRRDVAQRPASWLMGVLGRDPKGANSPDPDQPGSARGDQKADARPRK